MTQLSPRSEQLQRYLADILFSHINMYQRSRLVLRPCPLFSFSSPSDSHFNLNGSNIHVSHPRTAAGHAVA